MSNARLAGRYARSLLDLAIEQGQLEIVYADMKYVQAVCKASMELVNLLRSPIIKADQKISILTAVTKDKVSALTASFNVLLKRSSSQTPQTVVKFISLLSKTARSIILKPFPLKKLFMLSKSPQPP